MRQSLGSWLANVAPQVYSDNTLESEHTGQRRDAEAASKPLRVLSLTANPTATFYETQVSALEECNVECTTIGPPPYELGDGRSLHQYLRVWFEMVRELSVEYDVVHANYGLVGPIALAQRHCPVVMTLWGTDVMSDGWVAPLSKATARFCDVVVAPSQRLADAVPCESRVIQFDVDTERFRPVPQDRARDRLGWDREATIVLFPYENRPVKNYSMARRVVDRLSCDAQLQRVVDAPHEEMPLYYNASDALIVTSEREAGPMTVKEAAACNTPVVSTDVGFTPELLSDVRNSHVVDSEAAFVERLEGVLEGDGRSNGRELIEGGESMGGQLRSVYEELVGP